MTTAFSARTIRTRVEPPQEMKAAGKPGYESFLVADCGSNTTRVALVEIVDNAYRFVARGEAQTTLDEPAADVVLGVLSAIHTIETNTGRSLLDKEGRLLMPHGEDGSGVDAFLASSSAAEAMRVLVVGLVGETSTASAVRASHGTYTTLLDTISLDDYADERAGNQNFMGIEAGDGGRDGWATRQVRRVRELRPQVIVLAGGTDGAVTEPLLRLVDVVLEAGRQEAVLAMAAGETQRTAPAIIFAGNTNAREKVRARLGAQAEIYAVDNVRPTVARERLYPMQRQLASLYQERILPQLPGYARLQRLAAARVPTTAQAVGLVTQYIARAAANNRVLTLDCGGSSVSAYWADSTDFFSMVRGNFGMSFGLSNVLAEVGVARVRRWLPFACDPDELAHYALNKTLRPTTLPATERELLIEQAFAREAIHSVYSRLANERGLPYNRVCGLGGVLVNASALWNSALVLLDGLEPMGDPATGLVELELDLTMLMPSVGTLAFADPNAAAYVFSYDALHRLGAVIVPIGNAPIGAPAVTVSVISGDERREVSVEYGAIEVISLRSDEQALLEITPAKGFRIGNNPPGAVVRTPVSTPISGGAIGIIVDARGRPLHVSDDPAASVVQMQTWLAAHQRGLARTTQTTTIPARVTAPTTAAAPPKNVSPRDSTADDLAFLGAARAAVYNQEQATSSTKTEKQKGKRR